MNIEGNKSDFEVALIRLERTYGDLDGILCSDMLDTLGDVIQEYNGHFKDDIEELKSEKDSLENQVEELQDRINELED